MFRLSKVGGGACGSGHATSNGGARAASIRAKRSKQPNILFIMGDDIGWMQPSIYHRGLMVGETPNIDRIGREGVRFTDYVASRAARPGATRSSPA